MIKEITSVRMLLGVAIGTILMTDLVAAQPATLTLGQAVQQSVEKYPAVRGSLEQVSAAASGINLARTAYLPRADFLGQVNRATHNNVFGLLLPQSVIPSISGPLDTILSMRGVVIGGVYRAAIGSRAVLHGELIGREMGMSTWVSFAGTNDHALAQGEFVETPDGLKILLKALRMKGVNIVSIRNHTLGEHPQCVFVRFWGQDNALELAKKIRYVLDTQVGAMAPKPREKV
jgi:hypothetical protein